jgi:hypothetical protein
MEKRHKYVVRLEADERQRLLDLVGKGAGAASVLTRARILLKADGGCDDWKDDEIVEALDVSLSTVDQARTGSAAVVAIGRLGIGRFVRQPE